MGSSVAHRPVVLASGGSGIVVCSANGALCIGSQPTSLSGVISASVFEDKKSNETYVGAILLSKLVYVLRLNAFSNESSPSWTEIAKHELPKRLSSICFAEDPRCVVVADTTGDVFKLPMEGEIDLRLEKIHEKHLLLGHFSLLTDLSIYNGYICSCDRDNRVRVSRFPNAFVIEAFFLKHTEFVTCVAWVSKARLLSAGGDGQLHVWDIEEKGEQPVCSVDYNWDELMGNPIVICIDCHPLERDYCIVVLDKVPGLYVVSGFLTGVELSKSKANIPLGANVLISNACFDGEGLLWVSTSGSGSAVRGYEMIVPLTGFVRFEEKKVFEIDFASQQREGDTRVPCKDNDQNLVAQDYVRPHWLKQLRKKPIVDDWKGKKRRATVLS